MSDTTKRAMAESLKKLLAVRTLDKITVRDIVNDCGVNRQTFYYHFCDIYDLIEWMFDDEASRFFENDLSEDAWGASLRQMFDYLTKNAALVLNAYHSQAWEYLVRFIRVRIRPLVEDLARRLSADMDIAPDDFNFVVDAYQSASFGIIDSWLGDDMKGEYDRDIERFIKLVNGSMTNALSKFDRKKPLS